MIARHLGVSSKAGVAKHVKALEEQGLLQRLRDNGSFKLSISAKKNGGAANEGAIEWIDAVGRNDEAEPWETEPFVVPYFMLGGLEPNTLRAFRATDDAMSDKSICEGDVILIEKRHVRDGSMVVATVMRKEKETVLRFFYRDGANVELRPANESFAVLRLSADQIEVHGVFHALLRPRM
jgi:SOS-response transcriptional repressor LexA